MKPLETYLICDCPDQQLSLINLIENDSRCSLTILSASEALQTASLKAIPELLLCDARLIGGDGLQLLRQLGDLFPESVRTLINVPVDDARISRAFEEEDIHFVLFAPLDMRLAKITLGNARRLRLACLEEKRLRQKLRSEITAAVLAPLRNSLVMVANHELRTPATIINSSLELLAVQSQNLSDTQKRYIDCARTGMQRLNHLLNHCTNLMSSAGGAGEESFRPLDLVTLIRREVGSFQESCLERNILLTTTISGNGRILGHSDSLKQVFHNLLSNAIKYTPDGGQISVVVGLGRKWVSVSVSDNGIGIADSELDNIFESFYQLGDPKNHHSSGTAFKGGGPGLGLAVCRTVVESHRGIIWAESPGNDQGSTFTVRLPRYFSAKSRTPASAGSPSRSAKNLPSDRPSRRRPVLDAFAGLPAQRVSTRYQNKAVAFM